MTTPTDPGVLACYGHDKAGARSAYNTIVALMNKAELLRDSHPAESRFWCYHEGRRLSFEIALEAIEDDDRTHKAVTYVSN